jgi:hypothetical protein
VLRALPLTEEVLILHAQCHSVWRFMLTGSAFDVAATVPGLIRLQCSSINTQPIDYSLASTGDVSGTRVYLLAESLPSSGEMPIIPYLRTAHKPLLRRRSYSSICFKANLCCIRAY